MAGMGGKSGGKRDGSGRKSKAEELRLAEAIDLALGDDWTKDLLTKIHEAAKKGSFQHAQLLLAYKYGKPQDKVDLTTKGEKIEAGTKEIVFRDYGNKP